MGIQPDQVDRLDFTPGELMAYSNGHFETRKAEFEAVRELLALHACWLINFMAGALSKDATPITPDDLLRPQEPERTTREDFETIRKRFEGVKE